MPQEKEKNPKGKDEERVDGRLTDDELDGVAGGMFSATTKGGGTTTTMPDTCPTPTPNPQPVPYPEPKK